MNIDNFDSTALFGLLIAAIVVVFILTFLCIYLSIKKSKAEAEKEEFEEENAANTADLENQLKATAPYKIGTVFQDDKNPNFSKIVASFETQLQPTEKTGNTPQPPVILFDILNRFFKEPAKILDSFYTSERPFGITLPISRLWPKGDSLNTFYIIVKDMAGKEYLITSMKDMPGTIDYIINVAGGRRQITPTPTERQQQIADYQ